MASASLQLARELSKQVRQAAPDLQKCTDIVQSIEREISNAPLAKIDVFLKTFEAASRSFRAQRRSSNNGNQWEELLGSLEQLTEAIQKQSEQVDGQQDSDAGAEDAGEGLPSSVNVYMSRLKSQKKDLYKNPPVLPPEKVIVEDERSALPTRNKATGELTFQPGNDNAVRSLLKDFRPNQTPEEVLRGGAFGGTYFRPITSAVTGSQYSPQEVLEDTLPDDWIDGLDKKTMLTSSEYLEHVNKFKVKCGGSLGMWESSGWIADSDPYGWFQWYCRFYQGRRCSDDHRQISRWLKCAGPKGRFRSQLCNKILSAGAKASDTTISPVIRQTLFHWGLTITDAILERHRKRVS